MKVLTNKKYEELLQLCDNSPKEFIKRVVNVDHYTSFIREGDLIEYRPSLEWDVFATTSFMIPNNSTKAREESDLFNAKMLFRLFEDIPAYLANDPIFWTSLVLLNDSFRKYTASRWSMSSEDPSKDFSRKQIISRFFYEGTGANTKRNSAARLWWYCSLAYSASDEYKYVDFLLKNNDFAIGLIERKWAANRAYVRCLLVFASINQLNTSELRSLFKDLSSWLSVKVVAAMKLNDFLEFLIHSQFSRVDLPIEEYEKITDSFSKKTQDATTLELINWDGEYIASSKDVAKLIRSAVKIDGGFEAYGYHFQKSEVFSGDYCVKGDFGDVLSIKLY